ncbi:hypothetical protein [Pedobacter frigoris]|uniref:hypothetical protein n=1 Tax=Pedobacter frigoris TaxID=2571272 RepID=UPI00292FDEBE|nr:hypothetical protein [Pedobacter frigoris]
MERITITANHIKTICWKDDKILDWASGTAYSMDGTEESIGCRYGFADSAISSDNGEYVFIYQKLGTKGLLLKNGELLREINRSYYCSEVYEYPAAFATIQSKTYLIHCPLSYDQLDFEDVETGELITNIKNREPSDRFHSRLEISPDGRYLMSKGWVWHPLDVVMIFDLNKCIDNPQLLDEPQFCPNVSAEICTASFVDDNTVVIGSSDEVLGHDNIGHLPPRHICLWDFKTNKLSKPVPIKENFGNLLAIDACRAWDLFDFPKIIDISSGEIIERNKEVNSGKQQSAIINKADYFPSIAFNKHTGQIAIKANERIEVLTPGQRK